MVMDPATERFVEINEDVKNPRRFLSRSAGRSGFSLTLRPLPLPGPAEQLDVETLPAQITLPNQVILLPPAWFPYLAEILSIAHESSRIVYVGDPLRTDPRLSHVRFYPDLEDSSFYSYLSSSGISWTMYVDFEFLAGYGDGHRESNEAAEDGGLTPAASMLTRQLLTLPAATLEVIDVKNPDFQGSVVDDVRRRSVEAAGDGIVLLLNPEELLAIIPEIENGIVEHIIAPYLPVGGRVSAGFPLRLSLLFDALSLQLTEEKRGEDDRNAGKIDIALPFDTSESK